MKTGLLIVLILFSASAWSEDVFDIAAEYNLTRKDLVKLEARKRKVLSDIYSIEKETNQLVLQKSELDDRKLKLDEKLSDVSKRIVEIEQQVRAMIPELVDRLSFTEQVNNLPWLYTFLTSQSLSELDATIEAAKHINKQQADQLIHFVSLVDEMELKKKELKKTATDIVGLKRKLKAKELNIASNQASKKKILKNLERKLKLKKKNLKSIQGKGKAALADSFFENMEILFGSTFYDSKGDLPHPIEGPVYHQYGLNKGLLQDRIHLVHKGYFYRSLSPQAVSSVARGKIRFSGPVHGYGRVVVIEHGSRYYTTYANLESLNTTVGQEVAQGETLGLTGFNHLQFGSGLYFEIRHFSQPQNPEDWLKKTNKHLANL